MNIYKKLVQIQSEIKVPKGQYNKFGNYNYRSCEDILEAVKPYLMTHGVALNIHDSIELIGERYYVKATAVLVDIDDGQKIEVTAYAREEENKKGMDSAQITGSTSSYARKYALNGLFCIDDVKDADTQDNTKQDKPNKKPVYLQDVPKPDYIPHISEDLANNAITTTQQKELFEIAKGKEEQAKAVMTRYGYKMSKDIQQDHFKEICEEIKKGEQK